MRLQFIAGGTSVINKCPESDQLPGRKNFTPLVHTVRDTPSIPFCILKYLLPGQAEGHIFKYLVNVILCLQCRIEILIGGQERSMQESQSSPGSV